MFTLQQAADRSDDERVDIEVENGAIVLSADVGEYGVSVHLGPGEALKVIAALQTAVRAAQLARHLRPVA